jgi:hypothetical protein
MVVSGLLLQEIRRKKREGRWRTSGKEIEIESEGLTIQNIQ